MQCQSWSRLSVLLGVLALAGCSKLSDVGQLTQPPPQAVAATIGQAYTIDSSGTLQTHVRAGADVVLTGVNSENGNADTGVPIIYFTWQQLNPGSNAVDLIKRSSNTSSFTAPQVTTETKLTFQLTVTTANGGTASTRAQVTVEPARDTDHFLTFLNVNDHFTVTAVTSAALNADATATYSATVPLTIKVTRLVTYIDINGMPHTTPEQVGPAVVYSSGWSQVLGSGGSSCSDSRNPQIQVPIPRLNLDDLLADSSGNPTTTRLSDVIETSDIDRDPTDPQVPAVVVYAQIQISAGALPSGTTAGVCVGGTSSLSTASPDTLTMDSASLTNSANPTGGLYDTSASAHVYYTTIDPNNQKTTLNDWLDANGFKSSVPGWAADAHAIYTNNYDLGFGRDMYLKVNCPSGSPSLSQMTAPQLYPLIGQCDVATVVVNYVGVQAAAEHLNQIVAVAMEYSAVQSGGARIVKFYVFAPDTRTGELLRVTSVDLDHRGQKYVPGACVVCHGGTPGAVTTVNGTQSYFNGGDVGSAYLPWDLANFFYSDTDPGFSKKAQDAALKAQYTQQNQLAQFKLLNAGAYLTTNDPNRNALERELLEGWYNGQGLPGIAGNSNNFNATFVPAGWQTATATNSTNPNGNPTGSDSLYTNVFAHSCRTCHVVQVSKAGANLSNGGAQGSGTAACAQTAVQGQGTLGITDQFPMGCFWQFANDPNVVKYLTDSNMPFARRTMDQLWVDPSGYPSAVGTQLITELALGQVNVVPPGTTTLLGNTSALAVDKSGFNFQAGGITADVTDLVALNVTDNALGELIDKPSWQVCPDPGTGVAATESCAGASAQVAVIEPSTSVPQAIEFPHATFQIPHSGNFLIELDSAGSKVTSVGLTVTNTPPTIHGLPTSMFPLEPLAIDLLSYNASNNTYTSAFVTPGNGPLAQYNWWVSGLTNLAVTAQGANNCMSQAQACSLLDPVTLTLTPSTATTANYTINVADADMPANVAASSPVAVSVEQLVANAQTGFVCATDYLYAPGGPFAGSGSQAVLASTAPSCSPTTQPTGPVLDLSQNNASTATDTLQVSLQCSPGAAATSSCSNTQWVPGTLTLNGGNLQYSPPIGFSTSSTNGSVSNSNQVSPNYQLQLINNITNAVDASSGWKPLTLQVRANVNFASDVVAGVFQGGNPILSGQPQVCTSCHTPGTPPPDGLDFTSNANAIYAQLCGNAASCISLMSTYTGISGPFINLSSVSSSVLLTHPADMDGYSGGHSGGNRCPGADPSNPIPTSNPTTPAGINSATPPAPSDASHCDLTNVLLWIEDGANNF